MREIIYNNPQKVFVSVTVCFDVEGAMHPLSFVWEDGRCFEVDKIIDVRREASLKAGGLGMRYTCKVMGREVFLWYEDPRWFMERK